MLLLIPATAGTELPAKSRNLIFQNSRYNKLMKIKSKKVTLDSLDKKIAVLASKMATKDDIIDFKNELLGEIRDMRLETTFSFPK